MDFPHMECFICFLWMCPVVNSVFGAYSLTKDIACPNDLMETEYKWKEITFDWNLE